MDAEPCVHTCRGAEKSGRKLIGYVICHGATYCVVRAEAKVSSPALPQMKHLIAIPLPIKSPSNFNRSPAQEQR